MDRRHRLHRLHLKNQLVLDQQINPIPYIRQLPTVIHNRYRDFSQSMNVTLRKLISEACLIRALQQSRTKFTMNLESPIQNTLG
jgi:hypothetical protein